MKSKYIITIMTIMAVFCFSFNTFGQDGQAPGPCNFTKTETFCFTNNSDYYDGGGYFPAGACTYQICVKVKPKPGCKINCKMLLNPNGYWIESCITLAVGETNCITIPVQSNPITNCFDVDITMKVVGNVATLSKCLIPDYQNVGMWKSYHDHCLEAETWWSVLERTADTPNTWNFRIFTRGLL